MMMPTHEAVSYWRKPLLMTMPADDVDLALDLAAVVIDRARAAEKSGKIYDMQPSISGANTTEALQAGFFSLKISWSTDDAGKRVVHHKIFPILQPKT